MDSFDASPADNLRRALRGSPSLRRQMAGLGTDRMAEVSQALSGTDAFRFKGLYRDQLRQALGFEHDAAPIRERAALQTRLNDPNLDPEERMQLNTALKANPAGYGTIAASKNPYRYGSIASNTFGSLYR
jgi:hypothetical protein